jgi:hypothetical protein
MGLIRLLLLFIIGYFFYKMIKRFLSPGKQNPHVRGDSKKPSEFKKRKDIQDIDYEDIE